MTTQVNKRTVTLTVVFAAQIEDGVLLPLGRYSGAERRENPNLSGPMNADYFLTLTRAELIALGATNISHHLSVEYDVTRYVRSGSMTVS